MAKKSVKYGEYGLFEHLFFLWYKIVITRGNLVCHLDKLIE